MRHRENSPIFSVFPRVHILCFISESLFQNLFYILIERGNTVRLECPHCHGVVKQSRNQGGLNFCTHCCKLFIPVPPPKMPSWILGVLVILTADLQILAR